MANAKKTVKPDNSKEAVAEAQANHEHYKWYDLFDIEPKKISFFDALINDNRVVISEFSLGKKHPPVFIEPTLVNGTGAEIGFNHYAIDSDRNLGGSPNRIYLLKDEYKNGDAITWPAMVKLMALPADHKNTIAYRRWKEMQKPLEEL